VHKQIAVSITLLVLVSYIGIAHAEFMTQKCNDCIVIPDTQTLEAYKKTLPIVIWAENLNPGSTIIELKGQSNLGTASIPITISVTNPIGNIVAVDQITANQDGSFMTQIKTGGPLWKQDGSYIIKVQQGDSVNTNKIAKTQVDIVNGAVVPEFGAIATLVLLVAITSIIIVTAKGRLSTLAKI
jgi:predicted secreted protein with PEFG-CTERM motif